MPETKFHVVVSVDTGKLLPSLGETLDTVNGFTSAFGFTEKVSVRTNLINTSITIPGEVTPEIEKVLKAKYLEVVTQQFPQYDPRITTWIRLP